MCTFFTAHLKLRTFPFGAGSITLHVLGQSTTLSLPRLDQGGNSPMAVRATRWARTQGKRENFLCSEQDNFEVDTVHEMLRYISAAYVCRAVKEHCDTCTRPLLLHTLYWLEMRVNMPSCTGLQNLSGKEGGSFPQLQSAFNPEAIESEDKNNASIRCFTAEHVNSVTVIWAVREFIPSGRTSCLQQGAQLEITRQLLD